MDRRVITVGVVSDRWMVAERGTGEPSPVGAGHNVMFPRQAEESPKRRVESMIRHVRVALRDHVRGQMTEGPGPQEDYKEKRFQFWSKTMK